MTKIIDRCTLCGKVLKTNPEEACEGDECEGEYQFHNDVTLSYNFCGKCRNMLDEKDKEHNAWKMRHRYISTSSGDTYKSGELY